jgi:hypothetical protein
MSGERQRDGLPGGAGRGAPVAPGGPGGPGSWWWGEAAATLGRQLLLLPLLPFRLLGLGLRAVEQAAAAAQPGAGQAGAAAPAPPAWTAPPRAAAVYPATAPGPPGAGTTIGAGWPAAAFAAGPAADVGLVPRVRPPAAAVAENRKSCACGAGAGAAAKSSETQPKEGKKMSCCDQNLSGCDLKVIQYSIVSVDPYIDDDHLRIVLPGHPVLILATQDDLDDSSFTAYAIARAQRQYPEEMDRYRAEYLRVCYTLLCRFTLPCVDYAREQAEALRAINRTLREKDKLPPGGSPPLPPPGDVGDEDERREGAARRRGREGKG